MAERWTGEHRSRAPPRGRVISVGCGKKEPPPAEKTAAQSRITVTAKAGEPVVVSSAEAEFDILPSGYVQAFLLKDASACRWTNPKRVLHRPGTFRGRGQRIRDFALDFGHVNISDAGARSERPAREWRSRGVALPQRESRSCSRWRYTTTSDDRAQHVAYKNSGTNELRIDRNSDAKGIGSMHACRSQVASA